MANNFAENYIDVAERLQVFMSKYPEGSLQFEFKGQMEISGAVFIYGVATAYRSPSDTAPGTGWAWEIVPGRTPYTKGSELMVLETSAWGRAMAALGIETKRGIASRQEVAAAKSRTQRTSAPDPHDPWASPLSPVEGTNQGDDASLVSEAMDTLKSSLNAQETPHRVINGYDVQKPSNWGIKPASEKQINFLTSLIKKEAAKHSAPLGKDGVVDVVAAFRGEDLKSVEQITSVSASEVIDDLTKQKWGGKAQEIIKNLSTLWLGEGQEVSPGGIPRDHEAQEHAVASGEW